LFPAFDWAISRSHPEREERLLYTQDQLLEEGIEDIEGIEFSTPGWRRYTILTAYTFVFPMRKAC